MQGGHPWSGPDEDPIRMKSPQWLRRAAASVDPVVRLLCFPHAGGGASSFNPWRAALPDWIELVKAQLPGREDRGSEAPHTRVSALVADLFPHVEDLFDRPLVIYGHSVGSLIGFELTREIRRRGRPAPLALIVSSRRAPHRRLRDEHLLHSLPDDVLAGRIEDLGGVPGGMMQAEKWRSHYLPRIRADLSLSDTYVYTDSARLSCPLHAFIGEVDNLVVREDWERWADQAGGEFSSRVLDGGHFFSREGRAALIGEAVRIVETVLGQHRITARIATPSPPAGGPMEPQ